MFYIYYTTPSGMTRRVQATRVKVTRKKGETEKFVTFSASSLAVPLDQGRGETQALKCMAVGDIIELPRLGRCYSSVPSKMSALGAATGMRFTQHYDREREVYTIRRVA